MAVTLAALPACREKAQILKGFQAKMDPSVTSAEKSALETDAQRLLDLKMTPVDGSLIRLVFQGGEDVMTGVVRYLDERVNYIFSSE
jgi:hypothetical protein